jgi:HK97 family phage portal protein
VGLIENVSASSRMKVERRTIGGVPWQPWTDPFMRFDVGGPIHPTRQVFGLDKALALPALYAGSKILSDNAASLPIKVYQKSRDGRKVPYTGPHLFERPSVIGTGYDWMFTCLASLVLQGNAWGLVTGRDGFGFPTGIEWIPCEHVIVEQDDPSQQINPLATNVYAYGRKMTWAGPDAELFHLKGFALPGRLEGISPLRAFALTILAGHEAQRYGTDWYAAGGFPPGTFQNSELEVDANQAAEIRRMLVTSLRRREPLVYGRDWDYTPVTVPPSEAQFIDAMQLNATHIAAILDLPANRVGGKSGDSLTYSTTEQNQLQVIEALRPWLCRLEWAFNDLLPARRVVAFNTDALLKTDLKTRTEIYQIQRDIGLRTTDELRELEDLAPLPGGAGNESLPLTLMVSMAQRAGALPKSMLSQVVLLMDIAGKKLEDMQKSGLTKKPVGGEFTQDPDTGQAVGPANDPGQFYSNMMNAYSRELESQGQFEAAAILRRDSTQRALIAAVDKSRFEIKMPNSVIRDMVENYDDIPPTGLND